MEWMNEGLVELLTWADDVAQCFHQDTAKSSPAGFHVWGLLESTLHSMQANCSFRTSQDTGHLRATPVGGVGEKLEKEQHFPVAPDWDSNSPFERETNIQLCSTPALRVNLREAARESARCLFFSSVCKWHLAAFLARARFLLNSGSGEMSPATHSPSGEVYLIVHAGPPPCSASGGFAVYCTSRNAWAVTSSLKPSQPPGSQPHWSPCLPDCIHHMEPNQAPTSFCY